MASIFDNWSLKNASWQNLKDQNKIFGKNLWNKEQNAIPSIGAVAANDISFGLDDITKNFKTNLGLGSLLNMYSIPKTMVDAQFGVSSSYASPQMEEELRKQIMSDIRRTGRTSGGISYEDLGFDTLYNATGEHIDVSKNPGFRNPLGINSAQQSIGLTGGKMDYSVDPTTGKVSFTGGTDYNFGSGFGNQFGDVEWNPNISVDPALIQKEINAFSPQERYRQGQIKIQKPKEVYPNTEEHFKQKFQEDKIPFKVVREPWNKPTQTATPQQIQQATMMDNQLQHQTISKPVLPAPVKSTPVKGTGNSGPPGRNYSKPAAKSPSPVFKSYGPPNMQRFR